MMRNNVSFLYPSIGKLPIQLYNFVPQISGAANNTNWYFCIRIGDLCFANATNPKNQEFILGSYLGSTNASNTET